MNKKPEDNVSHYPYSIETRTALLEQSMINIDRTLIEIKSDIKESRKDTDRSLMDIRSDIKEVRREARTEFFWLLTFTIGGFVGMFGFMAHGFHWF